MEQNEKLSNPEALTVAGSKRATGINSQLSHELKITRGCKQAKLKLLVLTVLIGVDAVKLSAP